MQHRLWSEPSGASGARGSSRSHGPRELGRPTLATKVNERWAGGERGRLRDCDWLTAPGASARHGAMGQDVEAIQLR